MGDAKPLYRCPACRSTSVAPTSCMQCERPMIRDGAPMPLIQPHYGALGGEDAGIFFIGVTLAFLAWVAATSWSEGRPGSIATTVVPFAAPLAVSVLAWIAGLAWRRRARRRAASQRYAEIRDTQTGPIADAIDGPVVLRGTVRVVRPVPSLVAGVECAGYVCTLPQKARNVNGKLIVRHDLLETDSAIGELEIHDESGAIATLAAGPCVVGGPFIGGESEARIADGARVIVRGVGRWETRTGEDAGYRAVERRLVVTGTSREPLTLLSDVADERVRVDADERDERDEREASADGERAQRHAP